MSESHSDSPSRDARLEQLLADCLKRLEAGEPIDRDAICSQHPEWTDELRSFFANRDALERLAEPLRQAAGGSGDEPTLDVAAGEAPDETDVGPRLTYFGDYELLEEIAHGGMGVVYKARQISLNRVVAVKMILSGQLASSAEVRRFRLEAEAAANLDHPHIVPIYEIGEHQGRQYFSMGFVEGRSLAKRLTEGPLPPRDAADLVRTVALAVQYAHEHGVIHRDLKPGNILLDRDDRPRVTDFGLAKRYAGESDLTETGQVLGTPSYMPPEQAAGRIDAVGPASDVYALGAVLYALLAGRPPFQAASSIDTLKQVLDREPVGLRTLDPAIPRDLETVTLKCLEKSLPRRYASAAELADELDRFLDGRPVVARPVSRPERAWRWAKRNPTVASLSAGVVLLLAAVAIGSSLAALEIERQRATAVTAFENEEIQRRQADEQRERAEREEDRAVANLYLAYMNLAQKAWDDTALSRLRSLLEQTRPANMGGKDLRGIEWHYWNRLLSRYQREFQAHRPGVIVSMAFSPDGKDLITGAQTGEFKVSDAITGREIRTLQGFPSEYFHAPLDLSRDGKLLVTGAGATNQTKGQVIVWDVASGEELYRIGDQASEVRAVRFSPDGKWIVICGNGSVVSVWETATRTKRHVLALPRFSAKTVDVSPDGRLLAAGTSIRQVYVWELESGKKLHESPAFQEAVTKVAFSPDSLHVAAGFEDGRVRSIDATTGEIEFEQAGHKSSVQGLAYTPDGARIATCGQDDTLRVWSATDGAPLFQIKTGEPLTSCAFSPDGREIVSGSQHGRVRFWEASAVQGPATLSEGSKLNRPPHWIGLEFSRDGKQLAVSAGEGSGSRGKFRLYGWPGGELQHTIAAQPWPVSKVHISPDGSQVVSIETILSLRHQPCEAKVWDSGSGRLHFGLPHPGMVFEAVYDPTGGRIATACWDGNLRLWDAGDGKMLRLIEGVDGATDNLGEGRAIVEVAFSHDGRLLASATRGPWIRVWDARTGELLNSLNNTAGGNVTRALAFNHAGTHLAGASSARAVHVWDLARGVVVQRLSGHGGDVNDVVYSPDDRRIVSAGTDGSVKIWDAQTGQEVLTLRGHDDAVVGVDIHPDGRHIVSVGLDSTVKIWDFTPRPDEAATARAPAPAIDPSQESERIRAAIDERRLAALTADAESYRTLLKTRNLMPFLRFGYGIVLLELGQADEALPHLQYALKFPGTGGYQRSQLAQLLVRRPSLDLFHRLLNEGSDYENLVDIAFHTAAYALLEGRPEKYEEVRRTMRKYHQMLPLQKRGVMEIRTWTLAAPEPGSEEELMTLAEHVLAEARADLSTANPNYAQATALQCAALVHWRLGKHEDAIRYAEAAAKTPLPPELNQLILALAHHELGHTAPARTHLKAGAREPTDNVSNAHVHRILYAEALERIGPPAP